MDAPRGQLLADSSFSVNENRGISGCDRTNLLQNPHQSLTDTHDFASVVADRRAIGGHGREHTRFRE